MVRQLTIIFTGIAALCSCNELDLKGILMPTGPGVQTRFEQSAKMYPELNAGSVTTDDTYVFYVATDPHIGSSHKGLDIFNDALRNDGNASFGVILGDCTDIRDNLACYLGALAYSPERHSCNQRIFHVLGNHDIFWNGWFDFRDNVGPSVYWFETVFEGGKDLYICLDTATATLGSSQDSWFRSFLEKNRKKYRHCIILTHTNFFYTDLTQGSSGNFTIEESFSLIDFMDRNDVSLVLQGHDHYREDIIYNDVRYTLLGAISDKMESPEYLKIEASPDGIRLDWQVISCD